MNRVLIALLVVVCWCTVVLAKSAEEVKISYYDGTEYVVSAFTFYTEHEGVRGYYVKDTIDQLQPLLVKSGKLWHEVKGENVTSIRLEPDTSKHTLKAYIELKSGQTLNGTVPLSLGKTWIGGEYFWIQGITTKFGKRARFKKNLADIALVETLNGSPKQFRIKTNKGEDITVQSVQFGLYGSMPYSSPSNFELNRSIKLRCESLDVDLFPADINSLTFDENGTITLKTWDGETSKVSFVDITRFYGRTKSGEILFDSIATPEGAKIKSIEFPKPVHKEPEEPALDKKQLRKKMK